MAMTRSYRLLSELLAHGIDAIADPKHWSNVVECAEIVSQDLQDRGCAVVGMRVMTCVQGMRPFASGETVAPERVWLANDRFETLACLIAAISFRLDEQPNQGERSMQHEFRDGRWFSNATRHVLNSEMLAKLATRGTLRRSRKRPGSTRWLHSVAEICETRGEFRTAIMRALKQDLEIGTKPDTSGPNGP